MHSITADDVPLLEGVAVQPTMKDYLADQRTHLNESFLLGQQCRLQESSPSTPSEGIGQSNRSRKVEVSDPAPPTNRPNTSHAQDCGAAETNVDVDVIYDVEFQRLEAHLATLDEVKNPGGGDKHKPTDTQATHAVSNASTGSETSGVEANVNDDHEDGEFTCFRKFPIEM